MLVIDTGTIPENHPLRTKSMDSTPTVWVISSGIDDHWDCEFLLELGYPVNAQGVFGQWVCRWQGSDNLNELIAGAKQLGLAGVRGVV